MENSNWQKIINFNRRKKTLTKIFKEAITAKINRPKIKNKNIKTQPKILRTE